MILGFGIMSLIWVLVALFMIIFGAVASVWTKEDQSGWAVAGVVILVIVSFAQAVD